MKKYIVIILSSIILNSCFLAITGTPHTHLYKELNGKNDISLNVHCMYLNKTFEIRDSNPQDSLYIKSSNFKNPTEAKSLNKNRASDSTRYYNWRIGDMKYHKKIAKDTIEILKTMKGGNYTKYRFVYDANSKKQNE